MKQNLVGNDYIRGQVLRKDEHAIHRLEATNVLGITKLPRIMKHMNKEVDTNQIQKGNLPKPCKCWLWSGKGNGSRNDKFEDHQPMPQSTSTGCICLEKTHLATNGHTPTPTCMILMVANLIFGVGTLPNFGDICHYSNQSGAWSCPNKEDADSQGTSCDLDVPVYSLWNNCPRAVTPFGVCYADLFSKQHHVSG